MIATESQRTQRYNPPAATRQADKYSPCGQGMIMGRPTVPGEVPKR